MPDTASTLPEQIIEASRAFAQTLEMENKVFQGQLNSAIEMTVNAMRELIVLCKEAVAVGTADSAGARQNLANTAQQALSDVQNAASQASTPPSVAPPVPEAELANAVLHAVALSYQNSVAAQQQMYIIEQAAATQIITTILSVVTATLGVAVKEAEGGKN